MTSTLFSQPETVEQFSALAEKIKGENYFRAPVLFGIGREMRTGSGTLASMRYPAVSGPGQNLGTAAILQHVLHSLGVLDTTVPIATVPITTDLIDKIMGYFQPFEGDGKRHVNVLALRKMIGALMRGDARHIQGKDRPVVTFIFEDVDPEGVEDATLKLYGLSLRHFRPNSLNLTRIFTKLPNVAWVGDKVYDKDDVDRMLIEAAFGDTPFSPHMVDKFPLYIHRINAIDMGVRITDQHKVRLGAYLGEGTTLMPGASYVNFNAGTDGGMIEGRISSSAFVGKGSDVGGGASILGVLSGGNDTPISIGRNCLLEANSVTGIPLGDACVVAATTEVLAGTRVKVSLPGHPSNGIAVKAGSLAGINAVTFRRNSQGGFMEVVRTGRNVEFAKKLADGESILNADLHSHN